jgi:hypothetical protein
MSDRITFREFTEGVSVAGPGDLPAASIMEPKVKYIRGQLTDDPDDGFTTCGPGRDFPLEVTGANLAEKIRKIEEIFYRARLFWFESGSITQDGANITLNGLNPLIDKISSVETTAGAGSDTEMAYTLSPYRRTGTEPDAPWNNYFGDAYSFLTQDQYDGISESSIFFPPFSSLSQSFSFLNFQIGSTSNDHTAEPVMPNGYGITSDGFASGQMLCQIGTVIAYAEADHPFDPASRLFLLVNFELRDTNLFVDTYCGPFNEGDFDNVETGADLIIRLSDGDIKLRLLAPDFRDTTAAADIVIKPLQYWPYSTTTGDPAYDSTTGEPINGGPAA